MKKRDSLNLPAIKDFLTPHFERDQDFKVALRGDALLNSPRWNKGTAFTLKEREEFDLVGRLPWAHHNLDEQCMRGYNQLQSRTNPFTKNTFLQSLKAQNWVLYYTLLARHLKELLPIINTPSVDAIVNYSHSFRRSEGLYLSYPFRERMEEDLLHYIKGKSFDLIVVSDSEAIPGIGDQGVGGISVSIAKAVVYTLVGGIDPSRTLPIVLDVGTDNKSLLSDKLYVGWSHKRVRGKDYDEFIDTFAQLVHKHLPHCIIHFEGFGVDNARGILEKYRSKHTIFNDELQGTGAVALSALMSAVGVTRTKLSDQRIVVYDNDSAGVGIMWQLRDAMIRIDGISKQEANKCFYIIDNDGLVTKSLGSKVRHGQEDFVRPDDEWAAKDRHDGKIGLLQVVQKIHPTVLIGTSGHAGAFTEEVIKEMAKHVARPIIFPLSNPEKLVEVDPSKAIKWTAGKALLATGSPFPPAKMPNGKDYVIAECNNALIYPGIGFGAVLAESKTISDGMIIAGAQAVASLSPAHNYPDAALLPDFGDALRVNFKVAVAVAEHAVKEGTAGVKWKKEEIRERVKEKFWHPTYGKYHYDPWGEK